MSERPYESQVAFDRRYGEMRCRRYLFDRSFEAGPAFEAVAPKRPEASQPAEGPRGADHPL